MSFTLHNLKSAKGSRRRKKRVGRGNASGHGTYSTRGQKGQRARSGGRKGLKRKGMRQMLLSLPKMGGFKSRNAPPVIVNVRELENNFPSGTAITPRLLLAKGLVKEIKNGVKILGDGVLAKKFTVSDCAISVSARKKIINAGGVITAS